MLEFIKNALRRNRIKKFASNVQTGFIPLADTKKVNIVIDAEESGLELLKEKILAWGRRKNLKICLYFLDFRKLENDGEIQTELSATILRKELDWLGMPDLSKLMNLLGEQSDIFISLVSNGDSCIDFISKCAKARFKIGRTGYKGHVYDMVITGDNREGSPDSGRVFAAIADFLEKVR